MSNIAAIRAALAAAVDVIPGVQVFGYVPPQIVPPTFAAGEVEISYDQTFGGLEELLVKGRLYVSRADDMAGQALLDTFLSHTGASSIKAAIEADKTLGGTARTLRVERLHGYGMWSVAANEYLGAQFDVRVWAL